MAERGIIERHEATETLGARLERARLNARERRLERVVSRLQDLAESRRKDKLRHSGVARAAADFANELEAVRSKLRQLA